MVVTADIDCSVSYVINHLLLKAIKLGLRKCDNRVNSGW